MGLAFSLQSSCIYTWFEILDSFATLQHYSSGFVAQYAVSFHNKRSDATGLPEMNIRTTTSSALPQANTSAMNEERPTRIHL